MSTVTTSVPTTTPTTGTAASAAAASPAARGGSRLLAAVTAVAPLTVAGGVMLHPDDTQGVHHTLTHIAGDDRVMWMVTHLVEPFGWLLVGATLLLALPRLAPGRGRRIVAPAALLAFVGYASMAFIVYGHGEAFLFMSTSGIDYAAMEPLFEQFESGMPLAAIPSLGAGLGVILAGIGLLRARTVPRWAASLLIVAPVVFALFPKDVLPMAATAVIIFAPLVAGLAGLAPRIANSGGPALPTA